MGWIVVEYRDSEWVVIGSFKRKWLAVAAPKPKEDASLPAKYLAVAFLIGVGIFFGYITVLNFLASVEEGSSFLNSMLFLFGSIMTAVCGALFFGIAYVGVEDITKTLKERKASMPKPTALPEPIHCVHDDSPPQPAVIPPQPKEVPMFTAINETMKTAGRCVLAHPFWALFLTVCFGGYKSYDDNLARIGGAEPRFSDRAGAVLASALWWTDLSLPSFDAELDEIPLLGTPEVFLERLSIGWTIAFLLAVCYAVTPFTVLPWAVRNKVDVQFDKADPEKRDSFCWTMFGYWLGSPILLLVYGIGSIVISRAKDRYATFAVFSAK
jgi:hypothetical protein